MSEPMDSCSSGATASTGFKIETLHHIPRKFQRLQITLDLDGLKRDSNFHVKALLDGFNEEEEEEEEKEYVFEASSLQKVHEWEAWIGEFSAESSSPVHVVINGERKVFWYKSYGDWTSLRPHLVQQVENVVEEEEFIAELENYEGKVVTISGEFGMGKSSSLLFLMKTFQRNDPDKEVVLIDLKDYTHLKNFGSLLDDLKLSKMTDFSKAIVLFDSFDEVGVKHQSKIFKIFYELLQKRVHLILVACQKHREIDLVIYYSSKIFRLEPLSNDEFKVQFTKVDNLSGKFFNIISNREDELQTPLLIAKLVQLARNQPNKSGLINSPSIFKTFKALFDSYIDQYTTQILQIDRSRNFSSSELRSQKQRLLCDLGMFNANRLLGAKLKSVLRKFDCKRIRHVSKESSTVRNLLNFCLDLDHSTFREYFVAHFLNLLYVDLDDLTKFWQLCESILKADDLVNVFFFQMLSMRFEKSQSLSQEDRIRFNEVLQKIQKYSEDEQLDFVMGRNLTGCLKLLLQNEYTVKIRMILTVLENDFFEIIDYFHSKEILLTPHQWTIFEIASDYNFVKVVNHLLEKFPDLGIKRGKRDTTTLNPRWLVTFSFDTFLVFTPLVGQSQTKK